MAVRTKRERRKAYWRRRKLIARILKWGILAAVLLGIGYALWITYRPQVGEAIPELPSVHIADSSPLPEFNSDPPTSGTHYSSDLRPKFYHEADAQRLPPNPQGFILHNLEHGYVVFWYNCALVEDCGQLKNEIQNVMDEFDGIKLIAFPWDSLEAPVVMTSWGRRQALAEFDPAAARTFVIRNRNRAPESMVP